MPCALCGKPQGPKCEGGQVRYLSGLYPCALKVGNLFREPDPEPTDDWGVEPVETEDWSV